ncbi:MAG: hypothetical protein EXS05_17680 [Planctomycetaceae bacterium]|nr:hypothetical protein [Planctomycetaceae bacterium]
MAGWSSHKLAESYQSDPHNLLLALESWRDFARDILDPLTTGSESKWDWDFSTTTNAIVLWCDLEGKNIDPAPLAEYERLLRDRVAPTKIHDPTNPRGFRLPPPPPVELLKRKLEKAQYVWRRIFDLAYFLCGTKPANGMSRKPKKPTARKVRVDLKTWTVYVDGTPFTLDGESAARWLNVLATNRGQLISGPSLSQHDSELIDPRTDRLMTTLPKEIRALLEVVPKKGTRMKLT